MYTETNVLYWMYNFNYIYDHKSYIIKWYTSVIYLEYSDCCNGQLTEVVSWSFLMFPINCRHSHASLLFLLPSNILFLYCRIRTLNIFSEVYILMTFRSFRRLTLILLLTEKSKAKSWFDICFIQGYLYASLDFVSIKDIGQGVQ